LKFRLRSYHTGTGYDPDPVHILTVYEGVSKRFRTESILKYTLTFGITR